MADPLDELLNKYQAKPAQPELDPLDQLVNKYAKPAQKTQYGFDVRPTTIDLGKGPSETVQREDGAVWVDASKGWDKGMKGGEGWKFQANGQWVPAPAKPASKMGWAERNIGPEAWKSMGRNIAEGFTRPGEALYGLGADAANAVGLLGDKEYMQGVQARDRAEDYRRGVLATSGTGAGLSQMTGEAIPNIAAMAALKTALPAAGPGLMPSITSNAVAGAPTAYALTPGSQMERTKAAGLSTVLGGMMEAGAYGLGKMLSKRPAIGAAQSATDPTPTVDPVTGAAIEPPVLPVAAQVTPEAVGQTAKIASGKSMGAKAAQARLAEMAALNPEAKAAADRLGIELPADVFSDSPQVRAAAGLTRSVAGSEPESVWRSTVTNAVDKADEAIRGFDATFLEGGVSPGAVSQKVRDRLISTRNDLDKQLTQSYQQVDELIPKQSSVALNNTRSLLSDVVGEVGEGGLTAQEKRLVKMVSGPDATYGRLMREKNLIGQAIAGKASPYGDMETASLKRLYAAMAEDQLENVGRIGGEELRSQLHGANLLYGKKKGLEQRIISAFGDEFDGSIATKMVSAITSGAKGATKDFEALMKVVPPDLQKETIATALAAATRSSRGAERGGFGFSEFAKTYQGMRSNPQVYKKVVDVMGPDADRIMQDLYTVSQRITEARANVLTTGKANQALVSSLTAESLAEKILDSTLAKGGATAAAAMGGGPIGAGVTSSLMTALSGGKRDALKAAGNLFNSEEFKRLAVEAATRPQPSEVALASVAMGGRFRKFADLVGIPKGYKDRMKWLLYAARPDQEKQDKQVEE